MSQLEQLYRLQQQDSEIAAKKARLTEVLNKQVESPALKNARATAAAAAAEARQWQSRYKELNLDLETVNNKAKRSENRLYSGNVTNPKELEDLQHEQEALSRRRQVLEDEILDAMIMLEEAEEGDQTAVAQLATVETSWNSEQANLKGEQNELALHLHKLINARKQLSAAIDERLLKEYASIAAQKNGLAIVELKGNACQGCHLTNSADIVHRAGRGEKVTCGHCGRILYVP